MSAGPTRERLMASAQKLFSTNGYNATSTRAIADGAGTQVGSLTYHFGSKANLLKEIYLRHTGPMNQRRLELLGEACRIEDPDERLQAILRSYIIPAFSIPGQGAGGGAEFTRLRAIMTAEGNRNVQSIIAQAFDQTSRRFIEAIAGCLPGARQDDIIWRSHFLLGGLYYALINPERVSRLSDGEVDGTDRDTALEQLVLASYASFRSLRSDTDR